MKTCLVVLTSMACGAALAAQLPVSAAAQPNRWRADGTWLGKTPIVYDHTTLAAVRGAGGVGLPRHQANAAIERSWLCYALPDHRHGVWLVANGDTGAFTQPITHVQVGPLDPNETCPPLPTVLQPLRFDNGARLGMTGAELRSRLGAPADATERGMKWVAKEVAHQPREATRLRVFEVRFKDGAVDIIQIGQTTY